MLSFFAVLPGHAISLEIDDGFLSYVSVLQKCIIGFKTHNLITKLDPSPSNYKETMYFCLSTSRDANLRAQLLSNRHAFT